MPLWTQDFYTKQAEWSGIYYGGVEERHRRKAEWVQTVLGKPPRRILELGAGGGQNAFALAERGYEVVAVEQVPLLAQHINKLHREYPHVHVEVVEADFYRVEFPQNSFDAVCYWDGFGIGTDEEQRALLKRIRYWLHDTGKALIDVYTPWHAAKSVGYGGRVGKAYRAYGFDGESCRWIDRWWLKGGTGVVEQTLRCYSPADLRLLLEGTGLALVEVQPGGMMDYERARYIESAPLEQAMWYVAVLQPVEEESPC